MSSAVRRPRLGFLGVGWIGRHRMEAIAQSDVAELVGVADPTDLAVEEALKLAPRAQRVEGLAGLLALGLDGLVIATPSAVHAEQSTRALKNGVAVFCQKPLGRDAREVRG
ncbi:MAG TPA: Gfo/Idh/MocA family oxidoreductase, partial [Myxococcaceae bacterium]|nr:Gfo/Idh/MocA family oxidoreductase [Myxococcaceae bacterium]